MLRASDSAAALRSAPSPQPQVTNLLRLYAVARLAQATGPTASSHPGCQSKLLAWRHGIRIRHSTSRHASKHLHCNDLQHQVPHASVHHALQLVPKLQASTATAVVRTESLVLFVLQGGAAVSGWVPVSPPSPGAPACNLFGGMNESSLPDDNDHFMSPPAPATAGRHMQRACICWCM